MAWAALPALQAILLVCQALAVHVRLGLHIHLARPTHKYWLTYSPEKLENIGGETGENPGDTMGFRGASGGAKGRRRATRHTRCRFNQSVQRSFCRS
jgi:hypothetical protein